MILCNYSLRALCLRSMHYHTPPQQFKAEMRQLRRVIKFPRRYTAFVDVQLRMPPMVHLSPICQTPEPPAKIVLPLILHKSGLTFCRFSAKRRPCSHLIGPIKESCHE